MRICDSLHFETVIDLREDVVTGASGESIRNVAVTS